MTQGTIPRSRGGWQQDEIDLLFGAIRDAAQEGRPLRGVFADVGEQLKRKPNSIRNFYYAQVREAPELTPRQAPFRAFTPDELHALLRDVLMGRGAGESVRACVTRLAGGDRSAMLRYQNKYRSVLKNRPEALYAVAEELRAEGLPCPENVIVRHSFAQTPRSDPADALTALSRYMDDPVLAELLDALCRLVSQEETARAAARERAEAENQRGEESLTAKWMEARREADRLKVEVDLLKMALEDREKGQTPAFDMEPDGGY